MLLGVSYLTPCMHMGENAHCDAYAASVRKVITSRYKIHLKRLPATP